MFGFLRHIHRVQNFAAKLPAVLQSAIHDDLSLAYHTAEDVWNKYQRLQRHGDMSLAFFPAPSNLQIDILKLCATYAMQKSVPLIGEGQGGDVTAQRYFERTRFCALSVSPAWAEALTDDVLQQTLSDARMEFRREFPRAYRKSSDHYLPTIGTLTSIRCALPIYELGSLYEANRFVKLVEERVSQKPYDLVIEDDTCHLQNEDGTRKELPLLFTPVTPGRVGELARTALVQCYKVNLCALMIEDLLHGYPIPDNVAIREWKRGMVLASSGEPWELHTSNDFQKILRLRTLCSPEELMDNVEAQVALERFLLRERSEHRFLEALQGSSKPMPPETARNETLPVLAFPETSSDRQMGYKQAIRILVKELFKDQHGVDTQSYSRILCALHKRGLVTYSELVERVTGMKAVPGRQREDALLEMISRYQVQAEPNCSIPCTASPAGVDTSDQSTNEVDSASVMASGFTVIDATGGYMEWAAKQTHTKTLLTTFPSKLEAGDFRRCKSARGTGEQGNLYEGCFTHQLRVIYGRKGNSIYIVGFGNKDTQERDFVRARKLWVEVQRTLESDDRPSVEFAANH